MHGEASVLGEERGQRETCAAGTEFLPVLVSVIHRRHVRGRKKEREGAGEVEKG